jgi:hypothetical protein
VSDLAPGAHDPGDPADPADPGRHDRLDLTAVDAEGHLLVAAALTAHPVLGIVDGACTVLRGGRQRSVFASGRRRADGGDHRIGPLLVEADERSDTVRLVCAADDLGMAVDLIWRATAPPVIEPRRWIGPLPGRAGARLDETRVVRWGRWAGTVTVDDRRLRIDPGTHVGCRTRSIGRRPPGDGAEPGAPRLDLPAFSWWSATLDLGGEVLHAAAGEHGDGQRWFATGACVDVDGRVSVPTTVDLVVDRWVPGTRRPAAAALHLGPGSTGPASFALETRAWLPLRGLGIAHPDWAPGCWHDELAVGTESVEVDDLDPTDVASVPARLLVAADDGTGRTGIGIVDHLVLGPHAPSGLTGFTDPHDYGASP